MPEVQEEGYARVELKDLRERIAEYIGKKYPENRLYRQIFELTVRMTEVKDIAETLGMKQQDIYYYRKMNQKLAREYRERYCC